MGEHWAIESWDCLDDVVFGEDAHRARSGNIAALRNAAISLLHLTGTTQIAISLLTRTYPTLS